MAVDFCSATWGFVPDQENGATDTCGDLAENRKKGGKDLPYIFLHSVRNKKTLGLVDLDSACINL